MSKNPNGNYVDIVVVIPAYREAKNLKILIEEIFREFPRINVVVVDDSDKRENLKLKKSLLKTKRKLKIISRFKKLGRGSAVIEGLTYSLKDKKIRIFLEMDADLAHDPKEINKFLKKIKTVDMVVGSRYIKGSKIIKWPLRRLIQSKLINIFLKIWLGVDLTDYTNGYRAYNRQAVEFLVRQNLKEKGFISLSEIAFKLKKSGFKIAEVPISFTDRKFGKSSAGIHELLTSLVGAIRIKLSSQGEKTLLKKSKRWNQLLFVTLALLFTLVNYSKYSWIFFNSLGGETLAKVAPEILGLIFFLVLSRYYILYFYPKLKINITRTDLLTIILLTVLSFVVRFKQFSTYFFKDDFYLFLNHHGLGYNIYQYGPWLSSHPAWVWEVIRYFFGYSIFPYQLAVVLSHLFFVIGVYFLAKYLAKDFWVGLLTALLVLTTTITVDAFRWLTHPISFGWQGFLVCFSLVALLWEIKKSYGKNTPYLSAFLMMSAFGAGVARLGAILPVISAVDALVTLPIYWAKKRPKWLIDFIKRQWIFYALVLLFMLTRALWGVSSTRPEIVTAPIYRIFLYLFGVFTFPPEFIGWVSRTIHLYPGETTIMLSLAFFIFLFILFVFVKKLKKSFPLSISVGLSWVALSAFYFTLFGPHVPVTDIAINIAEGSHHLSYLASAGSLIIWGFLISKALKYFIKMMSRIFPRWVALVLATFFISIILMYSSFSLCSAYEKLLNRPKGVKISVTQFFFDTYRKYIPLDVRKLIVFYDDGYLRRKDNFKPPEKYFRAFWQKQPIKIIIGDLELSTYLSKIKDQVERKEEIKNLHYIFTDYYTGIGEDMTTILRDEIYNPRTLYINPSSWQALWGNIWAGGFMPEIIYDNRTNINYFKPPVLKSPLLEFPAVLTPKLSLTLRLLPTKIDDQVQYSDIRADILAHYIASNNFLDSSGVGVSAEVRKQDPVKAVEDFDRLISSVHVSDKMICGEKKDDNGILFFVSWVGAPDSYFQSFSENDKKDFFSLKYKDRYYALCYLPNPYQVNTVNIDLVNLGSFVRGIVIIPLSKVPVSLVVISSSLSSPDVFGK